MSLKEEVQEIRREFNEVCELASELADKLIKLLGAINEMDLIAHDLFLTGLIGILSRCYYTVHETYHQFEDDFDEYARKFLVEVLRNLPKVE